MNPENKILIVTNTLGNGGAQRVAVRLANALATKYDVSLLPFSEEILYPLSDKVKLVRWKVSEIQNKGLWKPLSRIVSQIYGFFYFARYRRAERPSVTLSFLNKANYLNLLAPGGGKVVLSERNNPRKKGWVYYCKARCMFHFADAVVFQSETVRNMFPKAIREKGIVIPNPVEVPCQAAYTGGKRIVTVGRLHPQKNQTLLIRAFARFVADHPGHTLHIYGQGDLREDLEQFIAGLSLQDKVILEGFQEDVHPAIRDAEMFVLSSDYEGMPNALLEAQMMGIPCISTTFDGAREFFGDTDVCILTPVGDEAALAKAMSELAEDELRRRELAGRAARFAQRYSLEQIIPLWEKVLTT